MVKYRTRNINALLQHQQIIERSLADFRSGRNTAHLSTDEIDQVVQNLEIRLATIRESVATMAS